MLFFRLTKVLLVASIAIFATLVAFGNVTDYETNFQFVGHVLLMDTLPSESKIRYRAINTSLVHHAAHWVIIATQATIAALCWIGAIRLAAAVRQPAAAFNKAKGISAAGLGLGILLWQLGFMIIGGEWFAMWQSAEWNGVPSAFRFVMIIGTTLIVLMMPDHELEG